VAVIELAEWSNARLVEEQTKDELVEVIESQRTELVTEVIERVVEDELEAEELVTEAIELGVGRLLKWFEIR
jgi:hypothetical protein